MESIVKSDIFFFVTSVCVFVVTALMVVILVNILHITKSVREMIDKVKGEADGIANDISVFRAMIRENKFGLKPIVEALKKKKTETEKTVRAKVRKVKKAVVQLAEDVKENVKSGINN